MITLFLIGIGTGNPDHVTREGERRLNEADLILIPRKGDAKSALVDLRRELCDHLLDRDHAARVVEFDLPRRRDCGTYLDAVEDWHDAIAAVWGGLLDAHLPANGRVALLIWGDPSLYDSSLRIADRLQASGRDLEVRVVPGITSLQALTAAHRIPLNELAEPVLITTGRQLRERGWPSGVDSQVVMLDQGGAFTTLDPAHTHIWWGAYLGMAQECLMAGPLSEVGDEILERRAELRARHGWIMDTYLLRRRLPDKPSGAGH
ncbi:precorrin-6A synthase (deacetylating) [Billgrantia azerbaijanica]|nr:precorrin-6A synthase (deacetylating) [Halomonas azerbaijanica]